MKNLIIFIRKEVLHILRDPKSLMIMVLLPLVEILLFGFVLRYEIENTNLAVYDMAKEYRSEQLVHRLEAGKRFKVQMVDSMSEGEELMMTGKVKAILRITNDFDKKTLQGEEPVLQLLLDASDPNTATTIETYLNAVLMDFFNAGSKIASPPLLKVEPLLYYNPLLKSVPGLIGVILMLICALMTSISLTREKETGTLKVLLISPLKPIQIIIGKVIPYLLVSFLNIGIILTLAFTVFKMPMAGSLLLLILVSLLYCITALALGFLISTKAQSQQVAMMISLAGLMLPTTLLSGMIYPIKNMPMWLQGITYVMPARWFVNILKHIMLKGSPLSVFLPDIGVLMLMTMVIIAVSLKNFKVRFK
jgi:ABC-2 type transport system permease protein